mgnify:CR=1 FL=1
MEFRIADTFISSLARLTGDEQKAVKTTAFDLQLNPAHPGLQFHKLDKARDRNFWSVRVNADIRLIVHRSEGSLLLCYVDHHDKAYDWAERRKLEVHPKTGAAQLVEIRETVREIVVPVPVRGSLENAPVRPLFASQSDDQLLTYGVPPEWLADVRHATEETVLALAERLPGEAAEALLQSSPRALSRGLRSPYSRLPARSSIRMRCVAFVSWRTSRSCNEPSSRLGTGGRCSCIRSSASGSSRIRAVRPECPGRPGQARPWWLCIALSISRAQISTPACCWRPFPRPWLMLCASICGG